MKHLKFIVLFVVAAILIIPTYKGMSSSDLGTPSQDWREACQWLKENTPQDALIIAWWDYGYWIEYLAEREAYLNPGQNLERTTEIAKDFLSLEDDIEWPSGKTYLIIDYTAAYKFTRVIAIWADRDYRFIDYKKTFMQRLYAGEYVSSDYALVYFNNTIKIWEVKR